MNFTLITAFSLCSLCWFSVSGSEFQNMTVQLGQDVTLTCSNVDQYDTVIYWYRVVDRTSVALIDSVFPSTKVATKSDRLQNGKYEIISDNSSVLLKIKSLDLSDSGLYVCGKIRKQDLLLSGTYLKIDGTDESDGNMDNKCKPCLCSKESDEMVKLVSVALDGLTVVLVMVIIGLVVQNLKLKKENNLTLNVLKTKELIMDFRRIRQDHTPLLINGEQGETVTTFRFLGTHISADHSWTHIGVLVKKAQQWLHFLRVLREKNLNTKLLLAFLSGERTDVLSGRLQLSFHKKGEMVNFGKCEWGSKKSFSCIAV
ncbi:uncharacterized protein LOC125008452 [Mugil cephalus]|uniref:uncharacterized protein LOC125008452 n=1 Tax=Mugil cephalus TaxID=48193 RepID=UPI001FB80396|nr:uncharacterized protein LOC125008452 [Mugil cephalus]